MDKDVVIEVVSGVEGHCVTLNNYRVAGQKPWGGGQVVHSFHTKQSQIDCALRRAQPENEPIVRCGECAKYQSPNCAAKHEQALMDFCSHGVRKPERSEG